jgi:hypothetical protein
MPATSPEQVSAPLTTSVSHLANLATLVVADRRRLQRDQRADLLSRLCMARVAPAPRLALCSQQGARARERTPPAALRFATSAHHVLAADLQAIGV